MPDTGPFERVCRWPEARTRPAWEFSYTAPLTEAAQVLVRGTNDADAVIEQALAQIVVPAPGDDDRVGRI